MSHDPKPTSPSMAVLTVLLFVGVFVVLPIYSFVSLSWRTTTIICWPAPPVSKPPVTTTVQETPTVVRKANEDIKGGTLLRRSTWKWSDEKAKLSHYVNQYDGDLQIETIETNGSEMTIKFTDKTENELVSWTGHSGSTFLVRDNVLYYADFGPFSSGCTVIAFDLKDKRELWKKPLKGLGPIAHDEYSNQINMEFGDGLIVVYGNEAAGRYVEEVDWNSGETVKHQVVKSGPLLNGRTESQE